jgi:ankyrin repeat protein
VTVAVALLFGWYVNWRTGLESEDTPALHWIIRSKNIKAISRALEAGADPNEKDRLIGRECAPLHVAVELSEKAEPARVMAAVELLLKHGADINAVSDEGTALQLAVEQGQDAIARGLLALGADPRRGNKHGKTPLHAAVRRGDREMIEALLAAGADINAQHRDRSVLGEAAWAGHLALIPWLLDKGVKAALDSYPLQVLASSNDPGALNTMQRLIDLGAPVTDDLLMRAATPEMIRFVAARGARMDRLPPDKNPARVEGDAHNLAERLRALRELGCNLSTADSYGATLLHDVARNVQRMPMLPEVLAEALQAGLDINAADNDGKTALYLMVERLLPYVTGRNIVGLKEKLPVRAAIELVAPLLNAGANPRIATKNGEDAIALAKRLKAPKGFLARLEQGANSVPRA